ncbi:MAG: phosphoenolpyruvate--protein phosphotransferase [Planctomycetaceae bacterium]|nr:phosphoenolpyruvate--protein phosphotransferase [Planctomycetales bacterium]MCB9921697.1 phosphoenolpyruvate--protein phosphotransferase [Planctomycetaceae bacterium]
MRTLQGIAVSPGVAIGEALIVDNEGFRIPRRFVMRDAVDDELQRLNVAIEAVADQISRNRDTVTAQLGNQCGAIFSAHLQMLRDPSLLSDIEGLIRTKHYSPEYAVSQTLRRFAKVFQGLDNVYLAERAHDIVDIERSLLGKLLGERREEFSHLTSPVVILAHNLTPTETASLDRNLVLGFVTEIGGAGGHTAIVAKGLEIPAVVGMGRFLTDLSGGELVIVDGNHGQVILQPDEETIASYRHQVEEHHSLVAQLGQLRELPAETTDGTRITLLANIEFPREAESCLERGADGIGLYRTEFLYLGAKTEPTEADHYDAYAEVIRQMQGRPVVIRTLDLGADKLGQLPQDEQNPFLGLRSIRLSLRNLPLFRVQLRAILRASILGPVRIMFPLISTLADLRQAKMVLADAFEDLDEAGVAFDHDVEVGMMVEVPAAVTMLDKFLKEVDFISIGTNDLIQYALAVDRGNSQVADRYQASDPAILRLLDQSLTAARSAGVPASVCGQMSGEPRFTMLLLGLGLHTLSVPPSAIPEIKRICRSISIPKCEDVARRAMAMESAREIDTYLREELRRVAPEFGMN